MPYADRNSSLCAEDARSMQLGVLAFLIARHGPEEQATAHPPRVQVALQGCSPTGTQISGHKVDGKEIGHGGFSRMHTFRSLARAALTVNRFKTRLPAFRCCPYARMFVLHDRTLCSDKFCSPASICNQAPSKRNMKFKR